jgi:hypothetical protein
MLLRGAFDLKPHFALWILVLQKVSEWLPVRPAEAEIDLLYTIMFLMR